MAITRGEHIPFAAYTLPGPGPCMACRRSVPCRTAVILCAPARGSWRVLLCAACAGHALQERRRGVLYGALGRGQGEANSGQRKACPHCLRSWPASVAAFQRNRTTRDGLESWCRECKAGDAQRRRRRRAA